MNHGREGQSAGGRARCGAGHAASADHARTQVRHWIAPATARCVTHPRVRVGGLACAGRRERWSVHLRAVEVSLRARAEEALCTMVCRSADWTAPGSERGEPRRESGQARGRGRGRSRQTRRHVTRGRAHWAARATARRRAESVPGPCAGAGTVRTNERVHGERSVSVAFRVGRGRFNLCRRRQRRHLLPCRRRQRRHLLCRHRLRRRHLLVLWRRWPWHRQREDICPLDRAHRPLGLHVQLPTPCQATSTAITPPKRCGVLLSRQHGKH